MRSRSWNAQRNGVNAPRSIDVVPSQTMWEMMRPEVDQHVLARKVRLRRPDVAGAGSGRDTERDADRLTPGVQAGGRQLELDGALAHSESGSLPRSPRRSRSFMSAGSSSYASAMDNSSIE